MQSIYTNTTAYEHHPLSRHTYSMLSYTITSIRSGSLIYIAHVLPPRQPCDVISLHLHACGGVLIHVSLSLRHISHDNDVIGLNIDNCTVYGMAKIILSLSIYRGITVIVKAIWLSVQGKL